MAEDSRIELLSSLKEIKKLLSLQKEYKEKLDRLDREMKHPAALEEITARTVEDFASDEFFHLKGKKRDLENEIERIESEVDAAHPTKDVPEGDSLYGVGFLIGLAVAIVMFLVLGRLTPWSGFGKLILSLAVGFVVWIAYTVIVPIKYENSNSVAVKTALEEKIAKTTGISDDIREIELRMRRELEHAKKAKQSYVLEQRAIILAEVSQKYSAEFKATQEKLDEVERKIQEVDIIQQRDFDKVGSLIYALENHYAETIPEAFRWIREKERDEEAKKAEKERQKRAAEEKAKKEAEEKAKRPGFVEVLVRETYGTPRVPTNVVYIDGVEYGCAPCKIPVPNGYHTAYAKIQLYYGGTYHIHQSPVVNFTVSPDATTTVDFHFDRPSAIHCDITER